MENRKSLVIYEHMHSVVFYVINENELYIFLAYIDVRSGIF